LYFFFTESRGSPERDPVVIWLQGGPGSSSLFGLFVENGPFIMLANGSWSSNPYSWNERANVLWIDNPVGTGFSFVQNSSGYVRDEATLAAGLRLALETFMARLPQYSQLPLYIFGESYAGKYVPFFASNILQASNSPLRARLAGIGIGNGWVDGLKQLPTNAGFLYALGRISSSVRQKADAALGLLWELYGQASWKVALQLDDAIFAALCRLANVSNYFDVRQPEDRTEAPWQHVLRRLQDVDFRAAMRVQNRTFCEGNLTYSMLDEDQEQSSLSLMSSLFARLHVLVYNGQYDLICNHLGTAAWVREVSWGGQAALAQARNESFLVDGAVAGWLQRAHNVSVLVLADAGHMAPFDQPRASQEMLHQFLSGGFAVRVPRD
jgi:carboxypeptidase C (cathepsin A)